MSLFPELFPPAQPITKKQGDEILSRLAEIWLLLDRLVKLAEAREERERGQEKP